MTETTEQWLIAGKLLTIGICVSLYGFGGISGKWKRRWIAPILAAGVAYWISQNPWSLLFLALIPTLSMGYGGDETSEKIKRRALWGAANGSVSALILFLQTGSFIPAGFQFVAVLAASILFGVWNPFNSARIEESVLGATIFTLPLLAA